MQPRKLLVLDLDSTLVWTELSEPESYDFTVVAKGTTCYVKKRPGLEAFLDYANKHFDLAVWSYAHKDYVEAIVAKIFTMPLIFVYSRQRCTQKTIHDEWKDGGLDGQTVVLKKLKKIWDRKQWLGKPKGKIYNRRNTLVLDDTPETYMQNYGNAIPIKAYEGTNSDREFYRIQDLLEQIRGFEDVRIAYKRNS